MQIKKIKRKKKNQVKHLLVKTSQQMEKKQRRKLFMDKHNKKTAIKKNKNKIRID